jgi:hypothetical protein
MVVGGGVHGRGAGIVHVIMIGIGFIINISQIFIMTSTSVGEATTGPIIGMGIGGSTNGFLTNIFNKTGEPGIVIDIGKDKKDGTSKNINRLHHNRDRN